MNEKVYKYVAGAMLNVDHELSASLAEGLPLGSVIFNLRPGSFDPRPIYNHKENGSVDVIFLPISHDDTTVTE